MLDLVCRNLIYCAFKEEGLQNYVEQVDACEENRKLDGWRLKAWKILDKLNMDNNDSTVAVYRWCLGQLRSYMKWESEETDFFNFLIKFLNLLGSIRVIEPTK